MTVAASAEPVLLYLEHLALESAFAQISTPVMRGGIDDLPAYVKGAGKDIRVVVTVSGVPLDEAIWDLPNLGLIACLSAGYDGIDVERARARGIQVTTGRGVNDEDVADMAIGLLLAAVRQIPRGDRLVRSGAWKKQPELAMSRSLSLMRCGIIGLGAIGSAIGRRLTGFGSAIAWWGPRAKPDAPWPRAESLLALARDSDVLIVAAPASEETNALVSAEILEALGPQGYLVNISRGSLVDQAALIAALRSGGIAGAGLDVFLDEPDDGTRWRDMENVVLTPHVAAWGERGIAEMKRMGLLNVDAFLRGEPVYTPLF